MARATYYYNVARKYHDRYSEIKKRFTAIYNAHKGRYGYSRILIQLRIEGITINHKTVEKLMKELGLKAQIRKVRYRSYKGDVGRVAPNILERNFTADKPNQKWLTDVTQVNIKGEKIYLSPILDVFNGEIVVYTISDRPDLKMVTEMLNKAKKKKMASDKIVIHSDQGWHYQHATYRKMVAQMGMTQSMSRKGNYLDNAMMENFFGIMKSELLYLQKFESMKQFKQELVKYIYYYNNHRIKLRLKGKSPVKYRALCAYNYFINCPTFGGAVHLALFLF